ncbi:MAG: hypothetical protein CME15_04730 [Gemmatimonadetes bacterium]|nr:hypothetical protein [Gemmatimonadota bacterium]
MAIAIGDAGGGGSFGGRRLAVREVDHRVTGLHYAVVVVYEDDGVSRLDEAFERFQHRCARLGIEGGKGGGNDVEDADKAAGEIGCHDHPHALSIGQVAHRTGQRNVADQEGGGRGQVVLQSLDKRC